MSGAIELELREELAKRSRRHMGRSRTVGGDELVGLERLHLHGGGACGRGGIDHGERSVQRPAVVEAELRDHEERLPIADSKSADVKRHVTPS